MNDTVAVPDLRAPRGPDRSLGGSTRKGPLFEPLAILCGFVLAASAYANLAGSVTDPALFAYFPPFKQGCNRNLTDHLGGEYLSVAKSLAAGKGFASPFHDETGPTSWVPPLYPLVLAALLWLFDHDLALVSGAVVALQNLTLIFTGWLVLEVARRTGRRSAPGVALVFYLVALVGDFWLCFQLTHDHWLVLLSTDVLVVVLASAWRSAPSWPRAAFWGGVGGVAALVSPVLGFVWCITALALARVHRRLLPFALSAGLAAAVVSPWAARNYLVLGRVVPVKSNLFFELHQSQCLEPDGVLSLPVQLRHPFNGGGERDAYQQLGEAEYLDRRKQDFLAEMGRDPCSYLRKVGNRLLAATVAYFPLDRGEGGPGVWLRSVLHPLPFCGLLLLLGLGRKHWDAFKTIAVLVYAAYLLPYVLVSYYDRYALPLLGIKVLFCFWAWDLLARGPFDARAAAGPDAAVGSRYRLVLSWPLRWVLFWAAALAVACWWQGPSYKRAVNPWVVRSHGGFHVPDFFQEWSSARYHLDGEPAYGPIEVAAERYLGILRGSAGVCHIELNAHPPSAVLLALPFAGMDFADAFLAWNVLSLWALATVAWLLFARLGPELSPWVLPAAVPCLLAGQPFVHQMIQGQLNLVLLLLITGAWAADRSGRLAWAGALVGAAATIKLFPGFLVLYFVLRRRWRAVAAAAASALGLTLVTAAVLGADTYWSYFLEVLPRTSAFQTAWTNCSLPGLWFKLFSPDKQWGMVEIEPLVRSRPLAYLGVVLGGAAVVAVLAALVPRARSRSAADLAFAVTVVAMLLVSPITWEHYFLLLLLPAAVVWTRLPAAGLCRDAFWAILFLLSLSPYWLVPHVLTLLGVPYQPQVQGWVATPLGTLTALSVHCYTLLSFFALGACLLKAHTLQSASPTIPDRVSEPTGAFNTHQVTLDSSRSSA
jgi:Glycosyltransferase family 87